MSLAVTRPVPPELAARVAELLAGEHLEQMHRIKERLLAGRGALMSRLSIIEAQGLAEEAARHGVQLDIRRWQVMPTHRKAGGSVPLASRKITGVAVLLFLVLLLAGAVHLYHRITEPPRDAGTRWHSATVKPQRIVPIAAPSAQPERPPPPVMERTLSQQLIRKIARAVVRITVRDAVGSGFFVSPGGLVVTNHHVVARKGPITVHAGTREAEARVLRVAPAWDLALLRVDMKPPGTLELADSARTLQTTPVFIVGSSEGLEGSVRRGRVSYVGRSIDAISLLELDIAATQGNSGGPVLDLAGRVVGIVNATLAFSGRTSYAILSNYLFDGADALLRGFAPTFPLSERFLKLQLKSLADIGDRLLQGRILHSSHAFVTGSRYLAVMAESVSKEETHGGQTEAVVRVRAGGGRVLLSRVVPATTSDAGAGLTATSDRPSVYLYFQLTLDEYRLISEAPDVRVEVRCEFPKLREILPLAP